MRLLLVLRLTVGLVPTAALANDIPLSVIGLPFAPEAPKPVKPDHPLYHRVTVGDVEAMPGSIRFSIARPSTINEGLRDTLRRMNLLAPIESDARARLTTRWVSADGDSMFARGKSASVAFHYTLSRIDKGSVIFDRQIDTGAKTSGSAPGGSMQTLRAAVAVNFASMAYCLDKAAYGNAPNDCALTPLFEVRVSRW